MIKYRFVNFEYYDKYPDNSDVITKSLQDLIDNCEFIVMDYDTMYPKDFIHGVGDSLRGATIEFMDTTMTYYYNVLGGYKKEDVREKTIKIPFTK